MKLKHKSSLLALAAGLLLVTSLVQANFIGDIWHKIKAFFCKEEQALSQAVARGELAIEEDAKEVVERARKEEHKIAQEVKHGYEEAKEKVEHVEEAVKEEFHHLTEPDKKEQ